MGGRGGVDFKQANILQYTEKAGERGMGEERGKERERVAFVVFYKLGQRH